MTSIGLYTLTTIGLILGQGFLLQVAVALTGDPAPKYGRAMRLATVATLLAAIGTLSWGFTFGWFFGKAFTATVSGLIWIGIATLVYRRSLNVSLLHAFLVSLVQSVLSTVLSSVAFYLIGHL